MAVTGNTEEVKTVLTIDTTKSASSMKELRTQIKQLKDELVGLDEGSQEYADTLVVLGEKMHQMREINEQVARTNTDWGDTISNVTNVLSGGVAAVQGLTAGLSLLGVEMGDDNKLTLTLVKSMALLQSLTTMDKAIKSFKALATVLKSNIAMVGGLSKALKGLAVSNPFTAILAGAAAVTAAVIALVNHNKKLAEAEIEVKAEADAAARSILYMKQNLNFSDTEARFKFAQDGIQEAADQTRRSILDVVGAMNRMNPNNQEENWGKAIKQAYDEAVKSGDRYKATLIEIVQQQHELRGYEGQMLTGEITRADYAAKEAEYNQKNYNTYKSYIDEKTKKGNKAAKEEVDFAKQQYDLALKRLNLQKTLDETELTARYEAEKRGAGDNAEQLLEIERKYQNDRKILNENYYKSAIKLAEDFKATRKSEADILAVDETLANLNKSLQEGADAWENYKIENTKANEELAKTNSEAAIAKDALKAETEYINRQIELTKQHNERYLALISDRYTLQADLQAEAIRYERELLENDNLNIDSELETLKAQHEAKLISEEEYLNQRAQLEQQAMENSARLRELDVEDEQNKLERKKELNEIYKEAVSGILSSISNLLSAAADQEDISFEDQKRIKTAQALISTFEAATSAYSAMAGIPVVGPGLGAAAAAAAIAAGLLQVRKIQQTTKNSASAASAGTTSAVTTVQAPPQIVNLNQDNIDSISLPNQRVYVVESDITDAQRRVQVVETNSLI